jgi:hypothetical protein
MKFISNIIIFFVLMASVQARDIIVLAYSQRSSEADIVRNYLIKNLNIPESFINEKRTQNPCSPEREAIVHICLEDGEENLNFPVFNHAIVKRSFQIFSQMAQRKNEGPSIEGPSVATLSVD